MKERFIELAYIRLENLGVLNPWVHSSKEYTDYAAFIQIYILYKVIDILS